MPGLRGFGQTQLSCSGFFLFLKIRNFWKFSKNYERGDLSGVYLLRKILENFDPISSGWAYTMILSANYRATCSWPRAKRKRVDWWWARSNRSDSKYIWNRITTEFLTRAVSTQHNRNRNPITPVLFSRWRAAFRSEQFLDAKLFSSARNRIEKFCDWE